jgi:SpoVK/Ycf46/Vps4 family AAA+-type ATPase
MMLCQWMDELQNHTHQKNGNGNNNNNICVIATSNRSQDIDARFRRGGRLEMELYALNTPDDRVELVFTYLSQQQNCGSGENWSSIVSQFTEEELKRISDRLGDRTGGYVAADIANLVSQLPKQFQQFISTHNHNAIDKEEILLELFDQSMKEVVPSCLRGITVSVPRITFDDILGYESAKVELVKAFHFYDPQMKKRLERFGMSQSSLGGILLYGPPGNSKTRLISAAASVFKLPLIALTSADIYSAYVGDAEAEIRKAFQIARQAAPCILFFDEMDSLVTNRNNESNAGSSSASVEARVLATFLNEMDGITSHASSSGVIVMGATNRLDCIDPALIRKVSQSILKLFLKSNSFFAV